MNDSHIERMEFPLHARVREWDADAGKATFWPVFSDYRIFDAHTHGLFGNDGARNSAYRAAIERLAPGSIAADIGTGPNLIWALACAESGVEHVYAYERDPVSFKAAAQNLQNSPYRDRITLYHSLPDSPIPAGARRINLCVSELVGEIGSSEGMLAGIAQAREHLLLPHARMIPERVATPMAAVGIPPYLRRDPGFASEALPYVSEVFTQQGFPFDIRVDIDPMPEQITLLTDWIHFEDFDFTNGTNLELPNHLPFSLEVGAPGLFDGFLFWIHLWCLKSNPVLDSLNTLTNSAPVFFPLFSPPIQVEQGWKIEGTATASLSEDAEHPDYFVEGQIAGPPEPIPFRHESWHSKPGHFRTGKFYEKLFPNL